MWNPKWLTIKEFAEIQPINVFHKELEELEIEKNDVRPNGLKNLHVLARANLNLSKKNMQSINSNNCSLKITADDYYKLYINGKFVTQGPAPAYYFSYYYNSIDITPYLSEGNNIIALHLYYQGVINRVWNSGDLRFAFAAECEQFPLQWKYQISDAYSGETVGYETQFLENFDSNKWDEEWNGKAYNDNTWLPAIEAKWADYQLVEQPTAQLSIYRKEPKYVKQWNENEYFIDMGEEITGALTLTAKGSCHSKIEIRCGEELEDNGHVKCKMRCNISYIETWTLSDEICKLEPYDYKGFRYAEVKLDKGITLMDIAAIVRHYPLDENACTFTSADATLNKIFDICKNGVKYGTQEGYLDCPTREKGQYLGDAFITAHAQAWLSGNTDMMLKCIDQFAKSATICPGLMAVTPGSFMQEIADFSLLWPQMLWQYYLFSGDVKSIKKYLPVMDGLLLHFKQYEHSDGLLYQVADKWNLVDWPENLRDNYDFPLTRPLVGKGCHNVINALYIGALKTKSQLLGVLKEDAFDTKDIFSRNTYETERKSCNFEIIKKTKSYIEKFYCRNTNLMTDSELTTHASLHSNVYALYFDLVPEEAKDRVADWIYERGFQCGVMHAYFVLKALAKVGKYNEVYQLLVRDDEHSYQTMIKEGATTCFEAWGKEQKWNTSLCHPWASGAIAVIIEDLAGVKLNPKLKDGYEIISYPNKLKLFDIKLFLKLNKKVIIIKK